MEGTEKAAAVNRPDEVRLLREIDKRLGQVAELFEPLGRSQYASARSVAGHLADMTAQVRRQTAGLCLQLEALGDGDGAASVEADARAHEAAILLDATEGRR